MSCGTGIAIVAMAIFFAAIIWLMGAGIVMAYNFAFYNNVTSVVFMLVNYFVFVDNIVLMLYYVLMLYNFL